MIYPQSSPPCPVCATQYCACGHGGEVTPVDIPTVETRMPSELRLYDVVVNGYATRMRLHDADAKRLGASPVDAQPDVEQDDAAGPTDAPVRKARSKTPNRARTADDNK